jgi:hypothetical protein
MKKKEVKPKGIITQYHNYQFTCDVFGQGNTNQYQIFAVAESPEVAQEEVIGFLRKHGIQDKDCQIVMSTQGNPIKLLSRKFLIDIFNYAGPIIKAEKKAAEKQYKKDIQSASKSARMTTGVEEIKRMRHII